MRLIKKSFNENKNCETIINEEIDFTYVNGDIILK
jgi:hypothetical protein